MFGQIPPNQALTMIAGKNGTNGNLSPSTGSSAVRRSAVPLTLATAILKRTSGDGCRRPGPSRPTVNFAAIYSRASTFPNPRLSPVCTNLSETPTKVCSFYGRPYSPCYGKECAFGFPRLHRFSSARLRHTRNNCFKFRNSIGVLHRNLCCFPHVS